jgi:hypothetical protein
MLCGGGGGDRVVKLAVLYDPVFRVIKYVPWINLTWPRLHKTTYAPMIYTSLCVRFLMWADRLRNLSAHIKNLMAGAVYIIGA